MRALGKLAKREDKRTFKLTRFMPVLPPIPTTAGWDQGKTNWGMMQNDMIGNCTVAGAGHMDMGWTMNSGNIFITPDNEIVSVYSAITGYDPSKTDKNGNNPTDTGADELTVLNYWRNNGIGGHKIDAFVEIPVPNLGADMTAFQKNIMASVHLFGGAYVGVMLPSNWEGQLDNNESWTYDPKFPPLIQNGHALPIIGYTPTKVFYITWGQIQTSDWNWFFHCVDEAYAIISKDFFFNGQAPNCFDMATLTEDLKLL